MKHMKFIVAAAASVLLCLLAGLTDKEDHRFADMWYQERSASDGDIVLVEIDQRSLEEIGPFQDWGRGVIAETIEILNQSEDCRPAVIGLDILYAGERSGEEDRRLALAAGKYGTLSRYTITLTSEAWAISIRWPKNPKPVTSVQAWTFMPSMASQAYRLMVSILAAASANAP